MKPFGVLFSHSVTFQRDLASVVDEAAEDGVSDGGFGDDVVPALDRDLAGDECRGSAASGFEVIRSVAFAQAKNAETGAKTLLGAGLSFEDGLPACSRIFAAMRRSPAHGNHAWPPT